MPAPVAGAPLPYITPAQVIQARNQLLHNVHGQPPIQGGGGAQINRVPPLPVPPGAAGIKALSKQEADFICRVSQIKQSNFRCHIVVC